MFRKACGGEGSVEFDCKFYRFEQPNAIVGFDKKTIVYPYGVSPTFKNDKGTCPFAKPFEVVSNQDYKLRGKKK